MKSIPKKAGQAAPTPISGAKIMTYARFSTQVDDRYLEDYIPGSVHRYGPIVADEEEMIAFAKRYDPQVYHTDPEAARKSIFGGLIASGWYTNAITARLLVDNDFSRVASLAALGIDNMRFVLSVRPGDRLWVRAHVVKTRRSRSKPERGILQTYVEVVNQHKQVVMTVRGSCIMLYRDKGN